MIKDRPWLLLSCGKLNQTTKCGCKARGVLLSFLRLGRGVTIGCRGPGPRCLGLDLTSKQGVDGVQPVVEVSVTARLENNGGMGYTVSLYTHTLDITRILSKDKLTVVF